MTIEQQFVAFHKANPHVYESLCRLAREAKARGASKLGIKQLWEVMRWEMGIFTAEADYRLNNNYHSRYARLMMRDEDDLVDAFDTRVLRTESELFADEADLPDDAQLDMF
jgi:hypothetical protein